MREEVDTYFSREKIIKRKTNDIRIMTKGRKLNKRRKKEYVCQ